ncbi:MAG: alpha/beta fold hydrolase [Bacillota bacterium]
MIEKGFAIVNGTEIYYEVKGNGVPLLLLHGMPLDSRMWDDQFENLALKFKVIRFDFPGCGQSGVHDDDYSFTDDIKSLLDSLEVKKAALLGFSVGGQIAIDFSLEYPEYVNSLILVSSGLPGWVKTDPYRVKFNKELSSLYELGKLQDAIDHMASGWVIGPTRLRESVSPEVFEKFKIMAAHNLSKEKGKGKLIFPAFKAIEEVQKIQQPVLLLTSEHDFPMFSDIADFLHQTIAGSILVRIPQTAHMIIMEEPFTFNELVSNFLNDKNR